MGGRGSGRRTSYAGKRSTEDSMPLDIRRLARAGVLTPGRVVSWEWTIGGKPRASIQIRAGVRNVTLSFRHSPWGRATEDINQIVWLESTPCTFGGERWWVTCPACGLRVAVLYGAGRLFACRHCKGLAYTSQSEADDDRALRHANLIRKRLGWVPGIFNGTGLRPKGMHWRTYERLVAEYDVWVSASLLGMSKRLGLLRRKVEQVSRSVRREL